MSQIDSDIQLKVWKDLALRKQLLISAATEALGLDAECSTTELKDAMEKAIQQFKQSEIKIAQTQERTEKEIAEMKQQVVNSDRLRVEAEEQAAAADTARETAERKLAITRAESEETVKKARADVIDKQNKLKAISKALADTPENVIKKLKNLKKQKLDESKLRTQTESLLKTARKEKTALETELEQQKALVEKGASLVAQVRELHSLCKDQNKKIKSLSEDKKDLFKIPKIDEELLKALQPDSPDDEKTS